MNYLSCESLQFPNKYENVNNPEESEYFPNDDCRCCQNNTLDSDSTSNNSCHHTSTHHHPNNIQLSLQNNYGNNNRFMSIIQNSRESDYSNSSTHKFNNPHIPIHHNDEDDVKHVTDHCSDAQTLPSSAMGSTCDDGITSQSTARSTFADSISGRSASPFDPSSTYPMPSATFIYNNPHGGMIPLQYAFPSSPTAGGTTTPTSTVPTSTMYPSYIPYIPQYPIMVMPNNVLNSSTAMPNVPNGFVHVPPNNVMNNTSSCDTRNDSDHQDQSNGENVVESSSAQEEETPKEDSRTHDGIDAHPPSVVMNHQPPPLPPYVQHVQQQHQLYGNQFALNSPVMVVDPSSIRNYPMSNYFPHPTQDGAPPQQPQVMLVYNNNSAELGNIHNSHQMPQQHVYIPHTSEASTPPHTTMVGQTSPIEHHPPHVATLQKVAGFHQAQLDPHAPRTVDSIEQKEVSESSTQSNAHVNFHSAQQEANSEETKKPKVASVELARQASPSSAAHSARARQLFQEQVELFHTMMERQGQHNEPQQRSQRGMNHQYARMDGSFTRPRFRNDGPGFNMHTGFGMRGVSYNRRQYNSRYHNDDYYCCDDYHQCDDYCYCHEHNAHRYEAAQTTQTFQWRGFE